MSRADSCATQSAAAHSIVSEREMKNIYIFLIALFVGGCGFAALPGPTSKTVKPKDISGTWQYTADYEKTKITLEVKADGTFSQSVVPTGATNVLTQSGVWKLDERNHIYFTSVLTHEGFENKDGWNAEEAHWWVTDGIETKLAIFGGTHPDPDSWQEFMKLR